MATNGILVLLQVIFEQLEAFPDADVESLQTLTDWHSLPRDEKGWLRYYPCFYTKYSDRRKNILSYIRFC